MRRRLLLHLGAGGSGVFRPSRTKHGVIGDAGRRREYAAKGIRVNAVTVAVNRRLPETLKDEKKFEACKMLAHELGGNNPVPRAVSIALADVA